MTQPNSKLVSALKLLEVLFDAESRPSIRWLREQQKRRAIPFVKWGHLVFFDPEKVRAALDKRNTVRSLNC